LKTPRRRRSAADTEPAAIPERPGITADALYRRVAQHRGITLDAARGHGFGSNALKAGGSIFAALSNGRLLVKLPPRRVEELIAAGLGELSTGVGRIKREWVTLTPSSPDEWMRVSEEARCCVLAQSR
jgi:hypothetical protein